MEDSTWQQQMQRWAAFWGRSILNAVPGARSVYLSMFTMATGISVFFGLSLRVYPGRGLVGPLVIVGFALLLFLCHGAYVTWSKEVDVTREERDATRQELETGRRMAASNQKAVAAIMLQLETEVANLRGQNAQLEEQLRETYRRHP